MSLFDIILIPHINKQRELLTLQSEVYAEGRIPFRMKFAYLPKQIYLKLIQQFELSNDEDIFIAQDGKELEECYFTLNNSWLLYYNYQRKDLRRVLPYS